MTTPRSFYSRREWQDLRYRVLRAHGFKCMACGDKGELHVDHIKPKSIYPELALTESNLQVLCRSCNYGKSNKFEDDLRPTLDLSTCSPYEIWLQVEAATERGDESAAKALQAAYDRSMRDSRRGDIVL